MPRTANSTYPYSADGSFSGGAECMEQLTLHAYLAACSKSLRLLTSVMVVPHRPPVLTAKVLATVDVLSGGRLIVGCGAGWLQRGVRGHRSTRTSTVAAPSPTSTSAPSRSYGPAMLPPSRVSSAASPTSTLSPSPCRSRIRPSGPAARALQPCAAPAASPTSGSPLARTPPTPSARPRSSPSPSREFANMPRTPAAPRRMWGWPTARACPAFGEAIPQPDGNRRAFTGDRDQIAEDIRGFAETGVDDMTFRFERGSLEETLEAMQQFAEEVMAQGVGLPLRHHVLDQAQRTPGMSCPRTCSRR